VWQPIWSWLNQGQCISECPRFQVHRLSKKGVFFWRYLWDFASRDWKDWRELTSQKALLSSDKPVIKDIMGLLPPEKQYKLNIDMQGSFWRDSGWRFGKPLQQYDSKKLYILLHRKHPLSPLLNAHWMSSDPETRWIHHLHSVWSLWLSDKLQVFAWLVVYQGLPSKARLSKRGLTDGMCLSCSHSETLKHILWECKFARVCWQFV
jgi:hypothetical protein